MTRDSTAANSDGDVSPIKSKLPRVGTTIFTVMSTLANDWHASDITVTAGATQGLGTTIMCATHPGDVVIVIELAYDSSTYRRLNWAAAKPVLLQMTLSRDGYAIPWERIATTVGPRTRMIMINSPHNPTGSALNLTDIEALKYIVRGTDILILSGEAYDGLRHESICRHLELAAFY